jgi:membrane protein
MTDGASQLAAGIAFYAILSLSPILVILVAISGSLYGEESARAQVVERAQQFVGPQGAEIVETALMDAHSSSRRATVIGIIALLFGATIVFVSIQEALNAIWAIGPKPGRHLRQYLRKRIASFLIVIFLGVVLLFSLMASTAVSALATAAHGLIPTSGSVIRLLDFFVWFVVLTFCFAVIYKLLPDVKIAWADVWVGAIVAAALFTIGKSFIAYYLAHSTTASMFGAASSLIVFLLWSYYSAQIFLIGGEFTQVYARRYGSGIRPDENSMRVFKRYRSA